ncbi:single-stranded-DNA-specific exonuclease RecJ [Luteimonas sp. RD2P54]|uniref:Single-stranded-DNA-specific exonuclease RecJ n=1 Tax=Luteimonas endophytica TaxID=3042023 RepID=A0ABT6J491_9GAMM|nr:single-stranded-DNA-specific exonuclease RecJ [Luteimonas endophytica]MDH5821435.1 single-stranded-DNA-specific exonuclease RecJ [Luteimonas endophytica]
MIAPLRRIRRRVRAADDDAAWPAHVPPLLRRIYAARGIVNPGLAQPRLDRLLPPDAMTGIADAAILLADAIAGGRRILVVGDFDCDGATACAVAVRGLRMLGARDVAHAVPNRMVHGYGLSPGLVEELAALEPDLLVTVDHGIACHQGVAAAKARGWRVLVTDHHLPGERLPPADVIVDPNLAGDGFPSKALAGVGVIFYVLLALRGVLRGRGAFAGPGPDLAALLDLVAVGTVADLVPLDANNRALVAAGLRRLRAGRGCPGLSALIEVAGRHAARLTAADIGYALAPRLNAAGRLEDMAIGIECLLCDEPARARELARLLDGINAERRGVQQTMLDEAEAAIAGRVRIASGAGAAPALCLFDPDWHPGVIGLVASKLKERLHRPVVAFAPAEPGSAVLRGSARSIPGFHIRDALAAVDAAEPGLIERFGGHAMAAGLSLEAARFPAFERAFCAHAAGTLDPALLQALIDSDGELQPGEFDRFHAEALRDGGPWGQGFPEPLFDGEFSLLECRPFGQRHLRLRLRADGRGAPLDAIQFGGAEAGEPAPRMRLAYRLVPDDYRGGDAIQLVVEHREPA